MKKHIVCFGDSNTHGYRAVPGGSERYDENERWTCLLQGLLGSEYLILEEGLSGRTTSFEDPVEEGLCGLDYIVPCLKTHQPVDLLVIMLGTNDTKERFGVNPTLIALGLERVALKAAATECWRNGKPEILIVTPQNIGREYIDSECMPFMGRGCAEKSEGLAEEYRELARRRGYHYLDANTVITDGPNTIDYMHLTPEAHKQLAAAMAEKIREIV